MYYAHFGLKEPPFKITPNTDFFYSGGNRGAILDALKYAIDSGEGIIKVVGEVGSGKTMLCRMLQSQLSEKVESIYLANPSVAPEDILHAIAFELQLKFPKDADRLKVMQLLHDHLLKRHAEGKQVVIFVEEAQGMPIETLEEIRLLSNLETRQDKLLQIVLFGQPELDDNLNQNKIRQLRERITHSFYLAPFEKKDIGSYIDFRLRKAGYTGPPIFSANALKALSKASEGLVRRANILADKALLATFSENGYQVTYKHVMAAIKDSEFGRENKAKWSVKVAAYLLVFTLLMVASYFIYNYFYREINDAPQLKETSKPVAKKELPILPKAPPSLEETTKTQTVADVNQESSVVTAVQTELKPNILEEKKPEVLAERVTIENKPIQAEPQIKPIEESHTNDVLTSKLANTKAWLTQQPASTATIQLFGVATDEELRQQLKHLEGVLNVDQIYIYRTLVAGNPFINVTYGNFATKEEAKVAIEQLPESFKAYQPRVRTIGGILKEIKPLQ